MAMELNGNLPDYTAGKQNYSSYVSQGMAQNSAASGTKKKGTEKTQETAGNSKSKSIAEYANELAKLVPSVEFKVGNSFSTAKSGKTLTVNPQLLEKMQNNPEKEKEMKELIKGVESAVNMLDSVMNASGWNVVFKHDYIDENGKYRQIALVRNDFMLNMSDKLREERRENSEKLIEKTKEKAAEKKEELSETLEEKKEAKEEKKDGADGKVEEKLASNKANQLLNEKLEASKDGKIYLYDTDIKTMVEAAKEGHAGKENTKGNMAVGANLDLKA